MFHTVHSRNLVLLLAAGTSTLEDIVAPALSEVCGDGPLPDHLDAILCSSETVDEVGLETWSDQHLLLEPWPKVAARINALPDAYPYLSSEEQTHLSRRASRSGKGASARAGRGRAQGSLLSTERARRLKAIARRAQREGRKLQVYLLVQAHSGTGRGTMLDFLLQVRELLPDATIQIYLVTAVLSASKYKGIYADNTADAIRLLERGAVPGRWWVHDGEGGHESAELTLFDDLHPFSPRVTTDPSARVQILDDPAELHGHLVRNLAAALSLDPLLGSLYDRLNDMTDHKNRVVAGAPGFERTFALSPHALFHVYYEREVLAGRVDQASLEALVAALEQLVG